MQTCTQLHPCMQLRSASCFWKIVILSFATDCTLPISAMQYLSPEVVFIDQCILNRYSDDVTASAYLNFFFNNSDYFMGAMKYFAHLSNWYHELTPNSESVWRSIIPGISCQQLMAQGIQKRLQKDYSQAIIL